MPGRTILALLALGALPRPAGAEVTTSSPTRALFVSHGLAEVEARALQSALARALQAELLDDQEVEAALAREALALGDGPEVQAEQLLARAKEEYVQLRMSAAKKSFDAALAALLSTDRGPASPERVAAVYFERALLALASRDQAQAQADLRVAATLAPGFAPDPDRYGPPALRGFAAAKRAVEAAPELSFVIERAPEDALVELDGRRIGREAKARGPGPHLLTVHRPGYRARSELVMATRRGVHRDVVLERAQGPLLAQHALWAWRARGSETQRLGGELGLLVVRSLAITRLLEATATEGGQVDLALYDGASGAVLRAVRGAKAEWEPYPWAQASLALAGQVLTPPPAPSLSLTAPAVVEPGGLVRLDLTLSDPAARVARLSARCGAVALERETKGSARYELELVAPAEEGSIDCQVVGLGAGAQPLVRAPAADRRAVVRVEAAASPWYESWIVWTAIGGAVVGGAALSLALTRPPDQVLVVHGP